MASSDSAIREQIIAACQWMNSTGLNQGTSGNISVRHAAGMLVTPSATPYGALTPEMLAHMPLDHADAAAWKGPRKPSTEWRFHRDILRERPDVGAVVHTHSCYATVLSIARRAIPPVHYMIAAFGGHDIRCAPYARFGTAALSERALEALTDRQGCLLANHGMIALGRDLQQALWRAVKLETLAKQYYLSLAIGPTVLTGDEIEAVARGFSTYGLDTPDEGA